MVLLNDVKNVKIILYLIIKDENIGYKFSRVLVNMS